LLTTRSRHIHYWTLEVRRNSTLFLLSNFVCKLLTNEILIDCCAFSLCRCWIRTISTEEAVNVISKDVRVCQHDVHCCTLFGCRIKHQVHCAVTANLFNESIFYCTRIVVKQCRSFSTKVLKNFKTYIRDLAEVRITWSACALT